MNIKSLTISAAVTISTSLAAHIVIQKYDEYKWAKNHGISWKQYRKLKKEGRITIN